MKIQVTIKSVYGNEVIYPVCDKAKLFAKLSNTKTLTYHSIQVIKSLGYLVEVTQDIKAL